MRGMNQALEDRFQFERFALKMEQTQARLDDSPRHLGTSVITAFDFESHTPRLFRHHARNDNPLHPTDRLTRLVSNGIAFAFKLDFQHATLRTAVGLLRNRLFCTVGN